MKKTLLICLLKTISIVTLLAQPSTFNYTPTYTSAGVIAIVEVNGNPASGSDWIAAFDPGDICAGAVQLTPYGGQTYCNLQVYGDDLSTSGVDEGMNVGETFTFKLWIAATGEILDQPANVPPVVGWDTDFYGSPLPGYDFADGTVLNFTTDSSSSGNDCTDPLPYPGDVLNGTCVTGYDFSIFTDSGLSPIPTCDFGDDAYAWFSWTAPITTVAGESLLLSFDAGYCGIGIEFYGLDCLTPVSNCLGNNSGIVGGIIQGTDYLIQLWDDGTGDFSCDFCLSIAPPPIPGDECFNPLQYPGDIAAGNCVSNFVFTLFNSSTGLSPFVNCAAGGPQVWFTLTTPITTVAGDPINLLFDDGVCDVAIEFYALDCASTASNCLAFSNGGIISGLTQGTDYLVTLEDPFGGGVCDFCLTVGPPPQPNDECTGAIPYPGDVLNGTCVTGYDFSIFTDSGQSPIPTCDFGDDAYAWFSWTAPITTTAGESLLLSFDAGYCGIGIEFYNLDCLTPVGNCLGNNSGIVGGITQGTDYLIQLWDDGSGDFSCDFCLGIAPPPPPGDECTNPLPYPGDVLNGTCVTGYDFSIFTDTGQSPIPTCDFGDDAYAWFSWTAPITTVAGESLLLSFDAGYCGIGIEFYGLDCLTPVSNCLGNNSGIVGGITQGTDYLIQLWDDGSGDFSCDFCLSIAPPPSPGDECINPIPYPGDIAAGNCVTGFDFTLFNSSTGLSPFVNCAAFGGPQVWFTVTTPITTISGDPINLLFNDGVCDVAIEFYAVDCASTASNCLAFSDGGLISGLTQGTDYLVTLEDIFGGGVCDFCLTVAPPPPPNDECTGAIPYPGDVQNGVCVTGFDFIQFTDSGISPSATCDGGDATAWFTFTAPVISNSGDPITLAWDEGINCGIGIDVFETDCITPVPQSCLNNINGLLPNLIQGNSYLLLIWDDGTGSTNCDFCLTIPVVDGCTDANACNFNAQAGADDGSCLFVGNTCDDGNPASNNDMINGNCTCAGTFPPGCNDILLNGSFETGDFTNWVFTDLYSPFFPNSVDCNGFFNTGFGFNDINPIIGNCMAVNGFDGSGPGFITLHQEVTIPANATSADFTFSWWAAYNLVYYGAAIDRLFEMQVLPVGGGAPLATLYTYTAVAGTFEPGTGWINATVDLSAFAGQTIWACFVETIPENFTGPAQVAIDNVSLIACTNTCNEEINGGIIVADPACDVSGIDITIIAADGTSIIVTTNADGNFMVPDGPFPCGDYTAAFTDPANLPACYTTTGSIDPIVFTVDGEGDGDDGPFFFANPEIPTLSQWGLISLALILMIFGALKLSASSILIRAC